MMQNDATTTNPNLENSQTVQLIDQLINTLKYCNYCNCALSEDEKIINARFIQQGAASSQDFSIFPICV
jgi:hypothetical protein